ncbi:MAG: hypothetical protein Q7R70_04350 [Candidatus Diapherotrites archaeon]|nr:hypothetical protein [Candidatus Diapherotrites archaeon]
MEFEAFRKIVKEQARISFNLWMKISELQSNPQEWDKMLKSLADGKIDPGDKEEITQYLLTYIKKVPEFKELKDFTKKYKKSLSQLYAELGESSDEEFEQFTDVNQKAVIDQSVEILLQKLINAKAIKDKRFH